jgi:aquaporin NIP
MRKFLSEFLGTYALVFACTGANIINQQTNGTITHVGAAITCGLIVMSMIYTFGEISGAHINPAVSIAFTLAGRFPVKMLGPYILSQLAGGILASVTLKLLFPESEFLGATLPSGSQTQSFVMEFILSFFLMLVIINVASGSKEQGMFAGIAIGGVVALEVMFAGPICGGSMNPIRSLAPAVVSGHTEHVWIYIFAPILGAITAVPVFSLVKNRPQ